MAGTPTTGETDNTQFMLGWGLFLIFYTHRVLPSFLLIPSSPSWMPDIAAVMPSAPLISPIVSQRGAVTTQPPTIAASASHPHHHVARYCCKSSLEPVDVKICGELIVDIIYGPVTLPLDPLNLTFDHHNPRSLQDVPCRSLSNSHLVVYEVADKGSVRAAS